MRHSHGLRILCTVASLTVGMQQGVHCQEMGPTSRVAETATDGVPSGSDLYLRHCAICHGLDGRGHGPLAEAMKVVPADLTLIAERGGGTFPDAKVSDVIRNGGGVLGHGATAMLPWGIYFSERHDSAVAKARIKALVAYIKSIQGK